MNPEVRLQLYFFFIYPNIFNKNSKFAPKIDKLDEPLLTGLFFFNLR